MKDTPQSLLEDVKNNLPLLYDVEEDYQVSLLKYSENIIYKVEFSKSSPVVFRIHRPGYHDIEELEGEISWMDEIHKDTQVRLPVVYRGRDGGFLQKMRTSGGENVYCSVISFLYGSPLGELKGEALLDGLEKLGEITARLHIQSINRDKSVKIKRFCWDINNLFGDNGDGIWGSWRDYEGITAHDYRILEKCTENIKKELAYAVDPEEKTMQICGRNMVVGLPQMLELSSAFVYDAIKEQLGIITDAIKTILERTPPELGVDIIANGIYLTGGSARIRNLDLLLQKKTGISVKVDEDPEMCVVRGLARVINEKEFRPLAFVTKEQKYV